MGYALGQTYISDLSNGKRGKRVSYELGVRIINLHNQYVPAKQPNPIYQS